MAAGLSRASTQENVSSTLSSGITDVATTITVADASKFNYPSHLVIDRVDSSGTVKATSLWEYVKVTNIAGNDLTVTRDTVYGTTPQSHSAGAIIEAVQTAEQMEEYYAALNPEHTSTGTHVISGAASIVKVDGVQAGFSSLVSTSRIYANTYMGAKGQFIWTQAGALATSIATAVGDTHLVPLRAGKNLTISSVWAGTTSAPSITYLESTFLYRSTPTSGLTEMLTNRLYIDIGEYTSDSSATVATLALTSLASGGLIYPSLAKHGSAGDLTLTINCIERA